MRGFDLRGMERPPDPDLSAYQIYLLINKYSGRFLTFSINFCPDIISAKYI